MIIREHGHNDYFRARLEALKARYGDLLKWTIEKSFHAKGMLGADYFLSGSMNLTLSGISVNGEHLVLRTDPLQSPNRRSNSNPAGKGFSSDRRGCQCRPRDHS